MGKVLYSYEYFLTVLCWVAFHWLILFCPWGGLPSVCSNALESRLKHYPPVIHSGRKENRTMLGAYFCQLLVDLFQESISLHAQSDLTRRDLPWLVSGEDLSTWMWRWWPSFSWAAVLTGRGMGQRWWIPAKHHNATDTCDLAEIKGVHTFEVHIISGCLLNLTYGPIEMLTLLQTGQTSFDLYCPWNKSTTYESLRFLYTSHASLATTCTHSKPLRQEMEQHIRCVHLFLSIVSCRHSHSGQIDLNKKWVFACDFFIPL